MGQCGETEGLRHLIMAAVLDTLGSTDDAIEHFRLSIQHGLLNPEELCIPAFASYELGLLLAADEEVMLLFYWFFIFFIVFIYLFFFIVYIFYLFFIPSFFH